MSGLGASGWHENYLAVGNVAGAGGVGSGIGATVLTMDRDAVLGSQMGIVAIEPDSTNCEVRKVSTVSGSSLTLLSVSPYLPGLRKVHPVGAKIIFLPEGALSMRLFGGKGSSADETVSIQLALEEASRCGGIWVDGQNKVYLTSLPIVMPSGCKMRQLNITARAGYAINQVDSAMVMNMNGNILDVTSADPITNEITIAATHGNAVGRPLLFKGASLPAPLVAGKTYYVISVPSPATMVVSETWGGTAVDITSTGTGTFYGQLMSLDKVQIQDCALDANSLASVACALNIQQQSIIQKFRVRRGTTTAFALCGQQGEFFDLQVLSSPTGLAMESANWMHFYTFNAEDSGVNMTRAVHLRAPTTFKFLASGGAQDAQFRGVHLENLGDANAVGFDNEAGGSLLIHGGVTNHNGANQKLLYNHTGSVANSGWEIEGFYFENASFNPSGHPIAVHDADRGHTLFAWDTDGTNRRVIGRWEAKTAGSALLSAPERYPSMYLRKGGGYVGFGGQSDNVESMGSRPGSGQTADQALYKDASGNDKTGVDKAGRLWTAVNAVPTDADILPNEAFLAHISTAGAPLIRFAVNDSAGGYFTDLDVRRTMVNTKVWDPPSLALAAATTTTITVTGAALGDVARASLTTLTQAGLMLDANVTATNTVTVTLFNAAGANPTDVASGTLRVDVTKY